MKKRRSNKPQRRKPVKKNQAASLSGAAGSAGASEPTALSVPVISPSSAAGERSEAALKSETASAAAVNKIGVFDFLRQVRAETSRVTWPTRNETVVTTIMVFIMVTLAALFFLAADQILSRGVAMIFGVFGR